MLKIKRPKTQMFEDVLDDGCNDKIVQFFSIYLEPIHVLSFTTDKHLIFLEKEEIKKCFNIFKASIPNPFKEGQEETIWTDEYSEAFAKRVRKEMGIKKSVNPLWFYDLIEEGYKLYLEDTTKNEPKVRRYWADPNNGETSKYIVEEKVLEDWVDVKLEGSENFINVYESEIIDVLVSPKHVTLDWLINHPEFDKDYYLHNIGGLELQYREFMICVMGDLSVFVDSDEIGRREPHKLLEFKDKLNFGDNCWIEIVNDEDFDMEYEVCSSFKEAKEAIDKLLN